MARRGAAPEAPHTDSALSSGYSGTSPCGLARVSTAPAPESPHASLPGAVLPGWSVTFMVCAATEVRLPVSRVHSVLGRGRRVCFRSLLQGEALHGGLAGALIWFQCITSLVSPKMLTAL